jgi:putative transposase
MPGEGVYEVKYKNRRTNVVCLLPNGSQEKKLRRLADLYAKLFNELNYERRRQFFRQRHIDFDATWDEYYEEYKDRLGVNAQAVMQKNNEAWSSLFSLLKLRRETPDSREARGPPREGRGEWEEAHTLGEAGQVRCRRAGPQADPEGLRPGGRG